MYKVHTFLSTILAATISFTTLAIAQQAKVEVAKPEFDEIQSPELPAGKNKNFKPKKWLEAEAKIKVQLSPEPKSKTADEITVKWFIAVKNPDKPGFLLLTKTVNHVNIPLNEDVYSSVYLSPASLKRLSGTDDGGKGSVEYVGFEVLVNGEVKAAETTKGKIGWWKTANDKISASDTVPLLDKKQTPFANHWWDRYAEVKREK
jgi:hypothetical protein